jgi:hypothetical protein
MSGVEISRPRADSVVPSCAQLARRFPHRFTPVPIRQEARIRFRGQLDQATTYQQYLGILDRATSRLEAVERGGVFRCGWQSLTDHFG